MLIVSSEIPISGPRRSLGTLSPSAAAATSNKPTPRSVPLITKRCRANSMSSSAASSMAPAIRRPLTTIASAALAITHEPRRIDLAEAEPLAGQHPVAVAGHQPDLMGLYPEPFADHLGKARLVSL